MTILHHYRFHTFQCKLNVGKPQISVIASKHGIPLVSHGIEIFLKVSMTEDTKRPLISKLPVLEHQLAHSNF